jgi:hypothetical protein
MAKISLILPDSLSRGSELRAALLYFARGLRRILGGLALQCVGQALMLAVFLCIKADIDLGFTEKLFSAARLVTILGIFLGFHGRRYCLRHAVAIRGRWLLIAALLCDSAALLAMLSPMVPGLPDLRDAWFIPEIASMGFVLLFLARLGNVIGRPELSRHAFGTIVAGTMSLSATLAALATIPVARQVGFLLPVIVFHPVALAWAAFTLIAVAAYGWLLVRAIRALNEFQKDVMVHAVEAGLEETEWIRTDA